MDRGGERTACITVRKNPTRLVKHPDSLWETSVVCSGLVAKAFPTTLHGYMWRLDQVSPIESFYVTSLLFVFPFSKQEEFIDEVQWR